MASVYRQTSIQPCVTSYRADSACIRRAAPSSRVTRQQSGRTSHVARVGNVTEQTFDAEVLKADKPVLVDFWSDWCGPCKLVAPMMDWVEKEYKGAVKVVKIEHDANPQLIQQYKVYGLPCFIVFKDGAEVPGSHKEGAMNKKALQEYLEKHGIKPAQ